MFIRGFVGNKFQPVPVHVMFIVANSPMVKATLEAYVQNENPIQAQTGGRGVNECGNPAIIVTGSSPYKGECLNATPISPSTVVTTMTPRPTSTISSPQEFVVYMPYTSG